MSLSMLLLRSVIVGTSAVAVIEPDADAHEGADADADVVPADADVVFLDRSSVLFLVSKKCSSS